MDRYWSVARTAPPKESPGGRHPARAGPTGVGADPVGSPEDRPWLVCPSQAPFWLVRCGAPDRIRTCAHGSGGRLRPGTFLQASDHVRVILLGRCGTYAAQASGSTRASTHGRRHRERCAAYVTRITHLPRADLSPSTGRVVADGVASRRAAREQPGRGRPRLAETAAAPDARDQDHDRASGACRRSCVCAEPAPRPIRERHRPTSQRSARRRVPRTGRSNLSAASDEDGLPGARRSQLPKRGYHQAILSLSSGGP
jgi:hypothetical protein